MWESIKEFLMKFLKSFLQDIMDDFFWYGTGIVAIIPGAVIASLIEDEEIALLIFCIIVLAVYFIAFRYKNKEWINVYTTHIWFTSENNAPVTCKYLMPSRLGSTELKSFNHSVWILTESNTGKLTGTRLHVPIIFEKEPGCITPYLFRAVCTD